MLRRLIFSIGMSTLMLLSMFSCGSSNGSSSNDIPYQTYILIDSMYRTCEEPFNNFALVMMGAKSICEMQEGVLDSSMLDMLNEARLRLSFHFGRTLDTIKSRIPPTREEYEVFARYFEGWGQVFDVRTRQMIEEGWCNAPEKLSSDFIDQLTELKEKQATFESLLSERLQDQ